MELKERVLQVINDNHIKNKGQRGLTPIEIMDAVNEDFKTIKPILNELCAEKQIKFRQGINHKLFYINERSQPTKANRTVQK